MRARRGLAVAVALALLVGACDGAQDREAKYRERGQELFERGDYIKASLEFRNALQINPASTEAMFYLGRIAEAIGDLPNALAAYGKVAEQDPKNLPALLKLAQFAILTEELDKALEKIEAVLAVDANNAEAHALKGAVLLRQGLVAQSEAEALKAQGIDPGSVTAVAVLAGIRNRQGRIDDALALVDAGIERNPVQESLYRLKLQILRTANREPALEAAYRATIAALPAARGYRSELAQLLAGEGRLDEAEALYRDALTEAPTDKDLKLGLVRFLAEKRGWQAAESQLVAFANDAPEDRSYQFALADLYASNAQRDKARAVLQGIVDKQGTEPAGLEARAGLARLAVLDGNLDEAAARVQEVLAVDAANSDALLIRAGLAADRDDFQDAIVDLRTVLRAQPNSIPALTLLAKAYQGNGQPELAVDTYRDLVGFDPQNNEAHVALAEQLRALGQTDEALKEIEATLKADPNYPPALKGKAILMLGQGNLAIADAIGKALAETKEGAVDGRIILGAAAIARKDYPAAIALLGPAVEAAPESEEALGLLVRAYQESGKPEAAADYLDKLVEANPGNATALVLLADTDYGLGRGAEAEKALRRAIEARPDWPMPYLKLASLFIKSARLADARTAIEEGLARHPGQRDLLVNLGLTEEALGNFESARKAYDRILQADPHELVAANNLAALIADVWPNDAQLMDQARRLAEPFRNSGDPLLLDTLGWIQLRLGNVADAASLLERASAAMPEHQQIRYHLGMVYRAQGDDKRAKDELAKAVAGAPDYRGIDDAKKTLDAL